MTKRAPPKRRDWSWRSREVRGWVYQLLVVGLVGAGVWYLAHNTLVNMAARGIQSGFGFLRETAGFDISETLIPFESYDAYWRAFLVGTLNTLRVSIAGVVLATLLGTLLGVGRFSNNAIVRGLCYAYVEAFRNVPVLLQLLMWYLFFTDILPMARDAITFFDAVRLSKDGLSIPVPVWELGWTLSIAGLVVGGAMAWFYRRWATRRFAATGRLAPRLWPTLALVLGGALAGWAAGGAPNAWSVPRLDGFALSGGLTMTPEFMAVLTGLVLYTSAFIAEVVRAGIASVPHGQVEAAASLGLRKGRAMRLVVLPQALRVIIPPLTSQYLNLTKNSSLAVAIGYPDIVSIANTSLNQTGRAVECIAIIMAVYLTISLATAAFMNWYNRRAAIKER